MDSDLFPLENHSFIIRVWRENTTNSSDFGFLRGHITHVPSENRQYIQQLDEIAVFIEPYLERMGIRFE